MSDHRTEADTVRADFPLSARPARRRRARPVCRRCHRDDLVIRAEIVSDPVGISGGVENIKIDKPLTLLGACLDSNQDQTVMSGAT